MLIKAAVDPRGISARTQATNYERMIIAFFGMFIFGDTFLYVSLSVLK